MRRSDLILRQVREREEMLNIYRSLGSKSRIISDEPSQHLMSTNDNLTPLDYQDTELVNADMIHLPLIMPNIDISKPDCSRNHLRSSALTNISYLKKPRIFNDSVNTSVKHLNCLLDQGSSIASNLSSIQCSSKLNMFGYSNYSLTEDDEIRKSMKMPK